MKKSLGILILSLFTSFIFAEEIKVEGIYQGENLFVMNPFASTGVVAKNINEAQTTESVIAPRFKNLKSWIVFCIFSPFSRP